MRQAPSERGSAEVRAGENVVHDPPDVERAAGLASRAGGPHRDPRLSCSDILVRGTAIDLSIVDCKVQVYHMKVFDRLCAILVNISSESSSQDEFSLPADLVICVFTLLVRNAASRFSRIKSGWF